MVQRFHFWVFIPKNQNQDFKEMLALPCSLQHCPHSQDVDTTYLFTDR